MTNMDTRELGLIVKDAKVVVSSTMVAAMFEKQHKHVLESIRALGCPEEFSRSNFWPVYKTINGSQIGTDVQEYLMTRDGFTLLAMGYNGERAMRFKVTYINAFNMMEQMLKERTAEQEMRERFNIPRDLGEALILAGNLENERKRLASSLETAKAKIEHDAPKVETFDAHYPDGKFTSLTAFARTLDGVNTMLIKKSLARCGYLYQTPNTGKYRVYAQYRGIDSLFVEKHDEMYDQYQIYVTNKGMQVITKLYKAEKLFMLKRFAA